MANFCPRCGRRLPESGICECQTASYAPPAGEAPAPQQPAAQQAPVYAQQGAYPQYQQYQQPGYPPQGTYQPQYQQPGYPPQGNYQLQYQQPGYEPQTPAQPSAFALAFKNLLPFAKAFLKNPADAVRQVVSEKNTVFSLVLLMLFGVASMLCWLTASLGLGMYCSSRDIPIFLPLLFGLFFAAIIAGFGILAVFLSAKLCKKNVSMLQAVTAVGAASLAPLAVLAAALLLNLYFPIGVLFALLFLFVTALSYTMVSTQVFEAKGAFPLLIQSGFYSLAMLTGCFFYYRFVFIEMLSRILYNLF